MKDFILKNIQAIDDDTTLSIPTYFDEKAGRVVLDIPKAANWLLNETFLGNSKISMATDNHYIYNKDKGCYEELPYDAYLSVLYFIFEHANHFYSQPTFVSLFKQLKLQIGFEASELLTDFEHIAFQNGVLSLKLMKFVNPNLEYFITSCLKFDYIPNFKGEGVWLEYLKKMPMKSKKDRSDQELGSYLAELLEADVSYNRSG